MIEKRVFLKLCFLAIASSATLDWNSAVATEKNLFRVLIIALLRVKKPICAKVAEALENKPLSSLDYNLHLRSANLGQAEATLIADAIEILHQNNVLNLQSVSFSHNPGITELGLKRLLEALPDHTTELGLVGCGLGDKSANNIALFLRRSNKLKMVCVESNNFSPEAKSLIMNSAMHLSRCSVIT
jgi:hypothetical protein